MHADPPRPGTLRASGPAGIAAFVVVAALIVSALAPALRWPVLVVLVVGLPFARWRGGLGWPVAAGIPVAVNQAWGTVDVPAVAAALADCTNLLSPLALWRAAEAIVVLGVVAALVRLMGSSARELCLVRPDRRLLAVSVGGAVVVAAASLALGTLFAKPFFGDIELAISPGALGPAMVLAVANGTMEEVIYRGVMLAWLTRVVGPRPALVLQALTFGAAHGGADFTGSPLPVMGAVAVGGLIAGIIVQRTRSLVFVIAIHTAFDVPLHPAFACRTR